MLLPRRPQQPLDDGGTRKAPVPVEILATTTHAQPKLNLFRLEGGMAAGFQHLLCPVRLGLPCALSAVEWAFSAP